MNFYIWKDKSYIMELIKFVGSIYYFNNNKKKKKD